MKDNFIPKDSYWDLTQLHTSPLLHSADSCLEEYFTSESRMCFCRESNAPSPLKFTYSAFHGVGYRFAKEMFKRYGVRIENVFHVPEQDDPGRHLPWLTSECQSV